MLVLGQNHGEEVFVFFSLTPWGDEGMSWTLAVGGNVWKLLSHQGRCLRQRHQGYFTCSSQYRKVTKAELYPWLSVFLAGPSWISRLSCLCTVPKAFLLLIFRCWPCAQNPSHASAVTQMLFQERLIDCVSPFHSLAKPGMVSSGLLRSRPEAPSDHAMNTP